MGFSTLEYALKRDARLVRGRDHRVVEPGRVEVRAPAGRVALVRGQRDSKQDSGEKLKPSKQKSHDRIDGISALVNALTVALPAITGSATTSARRCSWIYEQRFPTATGVPGAHPVAKRGSASLQSSFSRGRP